jgi:hypothetical protein
MARYRVSFEGKRQADFDEFDDARGTITSLESELTFATHRV